MGKQDDAKLAKLVKKMSARQPPPPGKSRAVQYDDTLKIRAEDEGGEAKQIFKEMKKREF